MVPVIFYLAWNTYMPPSANKYVAAYAGYRAQLTEHYLVQSIIYSTVSVFFKLIFLRYSVLFYYAYVSSHFRLINLYLFRGENQHWSWHCISSITVNSIVILHAWYAYYRNCVREKQSMEGYLYSKPAASPKDKEVTCWAKCMIVVAFITITLDHVSDISLIVV